MELYEQIRREYDQGVGTIKGVARKFGVHRRTVREALGDAVPRERKINTRGKPRIEPVKAFIEAILQGDENAPRKQRHTAHRIWSRIRKELPEVGVAESSIRRYVRELGICRQAPCSVGSQSRPEDLFGVSRRQDQGRIGTFRDADGVHLLS